MTAVDGSVGNKPSPAAIRDVAGTLPAAPCCMQAACVASAHPMVAAVTIPSRDAYARPLPRWGTASTRLLLFAALLCAVGVAAAAGAGTAQVDGRRVLQVQAAYLINFLRYSEWPDGPPAGAPLLVSVVGDERVVATVSTAAAVAGPIQGHGVQVLAVDPQALGSGADRQRAEEAAALLRGSQLVFLDAGSGVPATDLIALVRGTPVLTVSNLHGFIAEGGMIELYAFGRNIVFGANPQAIQDSGVLLSARVLKLAQPLAEGVD